MNRVNYIYLRERNDIDSIVTAYYVSKGGTLPKFMFISLFKLWILSEITINDIINYYDIKFKLSILFNKEGEVIKIY
tara:strand:- start:99 stop:329 length:231 start_codon:yes stop_codon:yes gene_type:complete